MTDRVRITAVRRLQADAARTDHDLVAIEAPLRIDLRAPGVRAAHTLGVFMRTPGDDEDLIVGLLFAERIIRGPQDVVGMAFAEPGRGSESAVADVTLREPGLVEAAGARTVLTNSACGLCGRVAIDALDTPTLRRDHGELRLSARVVLELPGRLRQGQAVFDETGGLHAAGLFDGAGEPGPLREDVGRHNAVDKAVGAALRNGGMAGWRVLAVSGRVAYEIVQKAALSGVSVVVAVGAPSSLAVDAARAAGLTLAGFVRDGRFNVYAGAERIVR